MKRQVTSFARLACIILLVCCLKPLFSAPISVHLPSNITANADFRVGQAQQPAVFLLHGFMSTHHLKIVQIMSDELAEQGYTVLAPTLSLKINNRHTGAHCDAVHTHTMESDIEEIGWWIQWLRNKGHKNVVVTGFSTGSLQVASFLSNNTPNIIKKVIFVSPAYLAGSQFPQPEEAMEIAAAKKSVKASDNHLHKYHLSYCRGNFVAPASVFLSYKKWTDSQLLETISKIKIPYVFIIGGEDHRFGTGLSKKLKDLKARVITVPGADHFFDSPYEFDFLDQLTRELKMQK